MIGASDGPSVSGIAYYSSLERGRALSYAYSPEKTHMPVHPVKVQVRDARPIRDKLDLDKNGFVLVDHPSAVADQREKSLIDEPYHHELHDLILNLTGADFAVPYRMGLCVRFSESAPIDARKEEISGRSLPAWFAHMDFTQRSFFDHIKWVFEWENIEPRKYSRAALIHTWRAVSPPPQDTPLMFTDGRTPIPGNYTVMDNIVGEDGDITGSTVETRVSKHSPGDNWYYFSNMQKHELLVFKGNDTLFGDTQNVLHTAFDARKIFPNAVPRESIEARFIVFWN
jgi:hypothetical protein